MRFRLTIPGLFLVVLAMASFGAHPFAVSDDIRGRDAVPDYARVFPLDRVNRLDISITAANWNALVADVVSLAGTRGAQGGFGGGGGQPGQPGQPGQVFMFPQAAITACDGQVEAAACTFGNPPTPGRCIQTGPGGQLACIALPGGGGGGGAPGAGGVMVGGGNQARDDVELLSRNPMYVPAGRSRLRRRDVPKRRIPLQG